MNRKVRRLLRRFWDGVTDVAIWRAQRAIAFAELVNRIWHDAIAKEQGRAQ